MQFKRGPVIQEFPPPEFLPRDDAYFNRLEGLQSRGMQVTMQDDQLQGQHRVVADGLLSPDECVKLMELTEVLSFHSLTFGTFENLNFYQFNFLL